MGQHGSECLAEGFQNPDAVETLIVALTKFQREHPDYLPQLGDSVIWSKGGLTPDTATLYIVRGIGRAPDGWNVTIQEVSCPVHGHHCEEGTEPPMHIVPAAHLARSADVLTDMVVAMARRMQEKNDPLRPPAKPRMVH